MTSPLTLTHLRFDAVAETPIRLGGLQSGERLRDALAKVMLRAVCPERQRGRTPTPEHAAVCPVCWLLAAQGSLPGDERDLNGEVRRAYALAAPPNLPDSIESGQTFSFVLTLFGEGLHFMPYFILAVPEVGRSGIGPGGGRFSLQSILAINPLAVEGCIETILATGDNIVRLPKTPINAQHVEQAAARLKPTGDLHLRFLTPTRLVDGDLLVKSPDFGVFFRRLLQRIDQVSQQYAGEARRPAQEVEHLHALADQVRLVEAQTTWVDLWGPSGRTGNRTPMGGFTGWAAYRAKDWQPLLPWLILGQGVQAGKLAAKGNGVFQLEIPGQPSYWDSLFHSMRRKGASYDHHPAPGCR